VWRNASIPLFCATKNRDTWGTIQCLPDNDDYQEIALNVIEAFDAWNNTVTEQAVEDVWSLFETSIKPCVKLTNTSVITESCDKHYWDTMRFRYCAPPGFALLRCNDTNYSGFEPNCSKVVAATCTRMMETQTSTWFGFNGTRAENRTYIYWHGRDNRTIISLNKFYNLTVHCKRPGNRRPRQAWCWFKGEWKEAMKEVKLTLAKHPRYKGTNDTEKIRFIAPGERSDPEVAYMWTNCRGEFLYCNMTWFLNWVENRTNQTQHNYVPCHIKQIINTWHKVGKNVYLPPREGQLTCNSTVTSIIANIDGGENQTNITFSAEVAELYRLELGDYKLIEVTPIHHHHHH
uniref:Envelope glycoprotein gp120 core from ST strain of HIV-2 n=1 Tax=Human immunodeficiency virus type 2 subtype A (isolate ST) TaxID=11721 RepID=UPI00071AFADE|nr:Chain G, Envelope glycoprotein gp120 core from ST strain of HIV-2 [Human immunodeficiency virus type 2 (ISOLATE ST)]